MWFDASGWLLIVVLVSWGILIAWITTLWRWSWKEDERYEHDRN